MAVRAAVIAVLVAASPVMAWNCTAHMITSSIASMFVKNTTLQKVQQLVDVLAPWYALSPDVITSGCWADDLADSGNEVYNQ
jgi:hypothetical protein